MCGSGTERKGKNSPMVRASRVLDLAEQEGLQTVRIPGACDGDMSIYFMIYDENGKTGSGKKFYHNVISGADFAAQLYLVAIVMPVIQFCEGGLKVDVNSAGLGAGSKPVSGLNAAGEVARGVHSDDHLGGNSLEAWLKHSKSWCRHPPFILRIGPYPRRITSCAAAKASSLKLSLLFVRITSQTSQSPLCSVASLRVSS